MHGLKCIPLRIIITNKTDEETINKAISQAAVETAKYISYKAL